MKIKKIYLYLITIVIGLVVFGFQAVTTNPSKSTKAGQNWGPQHPLILNFTANRFTPTAGGDEPKFYVHANFGVFGNLDRTASKVELEAAQNIEDVIAEYPFHKIEKYESVWIKSLFGETEVSLMSENNALSPEQIKLFDRSEVGDFFEVIINYQFTHAISQEVIHKRLNCGLTVVPENEAQFPQGYDGLLAYFNQNSVVQFEDLDQKRFNSLSAKFTINEDGKAELITINRSCGYVEIDQQIIELIEKMPAWTPAKNADGIPVKQQFELIYGWPGC
ncbi:MAG: hypothetical protein RIC15_11685 [Vicingaceae bacterium]